MQKVLDATPATDDADHIPLIVDQNPQVPSRIRRLIDGAGEDPGPVLADMARRLAAAGAKALAMPCNTAHHYAPQIRDAAALPFLDMVDLSVHHAAQLAGPDGRVGILASPAVRRIGLFDAALARLGVQPLYHTDEDALLTAIRQIKATGPVPEAAQALRSASDALLQRGAKVQMIACTEFSLLADATADGVTGFDTLDVLVAAIREFATGGTDDDERQETDNTTQQRRRP
jgi:aspartate racemase